MNLHTNLNFFSVLLLLFILFASVSQSEAEDVDFSYKAGTSTGPENWPNLKPEWKICGEGKQQSPIDLSENAVQESPQLGQLQIDYKPAPAVLKNTHHAILVHWNGDAGRLSINGTDYKLIQCHWHTPSEHTLDGKKLEMELHAVHQNAKGENAVIGILYKIGKSDPLLLELIDDINSLGVEDMDLGEINLGVLKFGSRYFRYDGSLTAPPCSEGVVWTMMRKMRTVSLEQLKALKGAVHHEYEENARPTQQLNERKVLFYNERKI